MKLNIELSWFHGNSGISKRNRRINCPTDTNIEIKLIKSTTKSILLFFQEKLRTVISTKSWNISPIHDTLITAKNSILPINRTARLEDPSARDFS